MFEMFAGILSFFVGVIGTGFCIRSIVKLTDKPDNTPMYALLLATWWLCTAACASFSLALFISGMMSTAGPPR